MMLLNEKNEVVAGWKIIGITLSNIQVKKLKRVIEFGNFTAQDIRLALNERAAVVLHEDERKIDIVRIYGIVPAYHELIYYVLDRELKNHQDPNIQSKLQNITGHRAPIVLDFKDPHKHSITFYSF